MYKMHLLINKDWEHEVHALEEYHHGAELPHLHDSVYVGVVVGEDLQHVPVQLVRFRADRVRCDSLGSYVLPGGFQLFIKGD